MSNSRIKILVLLCFSIHLISCNGQENGNSIVTNTTVLDNAKFPLQNQSSAKQISQVVRKVFQDSKARLWFGTQGGAYQLIDSSLQLIEGIKSETDTRVTIHDITESKDGKLWFGHTDGLSSYDGEIVKNYYESDGLINNDVWNVQADNAGNIWVGTYGGLCIFNGNEFSSFDLPEGIADPGLGVSSPKMIHGITEDSKGNIWICTNAGLFRWQDQILHNVSEQYGIQTKFINEIIESKDGGYWISTKDALYRLVDDQMTNVTASVSEIGKGIGSIEEDLDGNLYFVFNQHQLHIYDGKKIIAFDRTEDNKGPVIYQIYKDQRDRLWFVGFGGAYRLEAGKFIHISTHGPW